MKIRIVDQEVVGSIPTVSTNFFNELLSDSHIASTGVSAQCQRRDAFRVAVIVAE